MTVREFLFAALVVAAFPAGATEYVKETKLTSLSASATRPAFSWGQNREFIELSSSGGWTISGGSGGSVNCSATVAALPADNTALRAIALAAIASDATVLIYVDNTLPVLGDYCQISTLTIKNQ